MKPLQDLLPSLGAQSLKAISAFVVLVAVLAGGCASNSSSSQTTSGVSPMSAPTSAADNAAAPSDDNGPTTSRKGSEQQEPESTSTTTTVTPTTRRPTTTTTVPVTTTLYNPNHYFEITFDFNDYICEDRFSWGDQYDCVRYFGGRAPLILSPELYCSGPDYNLTCSANWYPNEMDAFEFVTVNYQDYACQDSWVGGWDGKDCYRYNGGDPSMAVMGWVGLYCSGSGYSMRCDGRWYPGELDKYEFFTIGYQDYICKDAWSGHWGDKDCYLYESGDPSMAVMGWVDLYCSGSGYSMTCNPDEYPSVLEAAAAEWADYVLLTIGWREYICHERILGDMPCVAYYGGSPSGYFFLSPDYYCNRYSFSCEPGY